MPSYQSQSLNFLRRHVRQAREGAARTLRQGTMLTLWTLQIVLYPIYLVFQSSRVVGRQLHSSVKRAMPRLKAVGEAINRTVNPQAPPKLPLTSDLPVKNLLRSLPAELPTLVEADREGVHLTLPPSFEDLHTLLDDALLPDADLTASSTDIPSGTMIQSARSSSLAQTSVSNPGLVADGSVRIQGVASLISDRRLVLVATHNGILDILSQAQQQHLQERIILEIAHYRQCQRELLPAPRPELRRLPLPKVTDRQWLLVQWFQRVMAWMQTSDVAIATNIFEEALIPSHPSFAVHPPARPQRQLSAWDWDKAAMPKTTFARHLKAIPQNAPSTSSPELKVNPPSQLKVQSLGSALRTFWTTALSRLKDGSIAPSSPALTPSAEQELELLSWNYSSAIAPFGSTSITHSAPTSQPSRLKVAAPASRGDRTYAAVTASPLTTLEDTANADQSSLETLDPATTTSVEAQPDWIETSAIVVGYAKHPLELILEWLDSGLVWVEQQMARIRQWFSNQPPQS